MGVDNAALARRYMTEIWGKGNLDAIDELCDDAISLQDPMTPTPAVGKQEIRKRIHEMAPMFSDIDLSIKDVIVSGDRVVVLHTWRGKHTGDFFGIKATGKTLTCETVEVLRMKNGKVAENLSSFDVYGMFQQLGALPPPDQLEAAGAQRTAQQPTA